MSHRRVILWCSVAIGAAILFYFFPLFRIKPIGDARDVRQAPTNVASPVDITEYAGEFWNHRLRAAIGNAVDIEELFEAVDRDADQARRTFGRQVGLGGGWFFFVRGRGRVEDVAPDQCTLKIGERSRRARILLGVIVGNAVRDSTGLIDVNRFASSQDFNKLSAELNQRVETQVIAPSRGRLRVGARIRFVGCAQVSDDGDFGPLCLVPVHLEIGDSETRP